jgi:hypothetical protein
MAVKRDKGVLLSVLKRRLGAFRHNPPEIRDRLLLTFGINPLNDLAQIGWSQFERIILTLTSNKDNTRLSLLSDFILATKPTHSISGKELKQLLKTVLFKLDRKLSPSQTKLYDLLEPALHDLPQLAAASLQQLLGHLKLRPQDLVSLLLDHF